MTLLNTPIKKITTIKKRTEFLIAKNSGLYYINECFLLQAFATTSNTNQNNQPHRFGLTVSKKIGCAVKRNKVKRRLRSIFKQILSTNTQALSYVLIAKKQINDCKFAELLRQIDFGKTFIEKKYTQKHRIPATRKSNTQEHDN